MIFINKNIFLRYISICILIIFMNGCVSIETKPVSSRLQVDQKPNTLSYPKAYDPISDPIDEFIQKLQVPLDVKIIGYVNKDILEIFPTPKGLNAINHVTRGTKIFIFETKGDWANISADRDYPYWLNLKSICFTEKCWKQNQSYKTQQGINKSNAVRPLINQPKAQKSNAKSNKITISNSAGKGYTNVDGNYVPSPKKSNKQPPGATAKCRDGTWSFSQNTRGTCSHHGGVAAWL